MMNCPSKCAAKESGFGPLVGTSPRMQEVYSLLDKVSRVETDVLLLGETGTGKELVAHAVHRCSRRGSGPFIPVDCAGVAPTLFESELFGHTRGAFTGAVQPKRGLIEAASGGTLFLDEIGELSIEMQAKLLRVLQEREVRPVGAIEKVAIDVRVVAATNRELPQEVQQGRFRPDLYYRLNVVPIRLPPLRDRKEDIPLLVSHFLASNAAGRHPAPAFTEEAMACLLEYDWPGNVRELGNAVARALVLNSDPELCLCDLPADVHDRFPVHRLLDGGNTTLFEMEHRAIFRAIAETRGDKVAAARILGIGRTTLYRKLKQFGEARRLERPPADKRAGSSSDRLNDDPVHAGCKGGGPRLT